MTTQLKPPFSLSRSNKIYFGIVAGISILISFSLFKTTAAQTGELVGRLTGFLLFPALIAWVSWRLSGKKQNAGSFAFNAILSLLLIGQMGQMVTNYQKTQQLEEFDGMKVKFKDAVSNSDELQDFDRAYEEMVGSVKEGLSRLSESSSGSEKEFYQIMNGFISDMQATVQSWNESLNNVMEPRIMDYSVLNTNEEFKYQKDVLKQYVENTQAYRELFDGMVPELQKRLAALGNNSKFAAGAVRGARSKYLLQKPIMEPLLAAHTSYGESMIKILDLLQANRSGWKYENDELQFHQDDLLNEYNKLIDRIGKNEEVINTLADELLKTM